MSVVRFCADLHFGHENMAKKRGFISSEEHDNFIIGRWNEVVEKKDVTYILGDITMSKKSPYPLLSKLNGTKKVVLGNHDRLQDVPELLKYVQGVSGVYQYKKEIFLTHVPVHPMEFDYRMKTNIHGHIHEKIVKRFCLRDERYICVSMEHIQYQPKSLEELGVKLKN